MTLSAIACMASLLVLQAGTAIWAFLSIRRIRRQVEEIHCSIVRSMHEDDKKLAEKVVETQRRLWGSMGGVDAMREARRLHGLPG